MNVGKIFSAGSQERVFQLKAKRDAGIDTPRWQEPQFLTCKKCERRATRQGRQALAPGRVKICPRG